MHHYHPINCIHCKGVNLFKNGHSENGTQRWRCHECGKNFQLDYRYNARKPGIKAQITELTLNSSGVRDISRILSISKNTVVSELKKTPRTNPYLLNLVRTLQLKHLEVGYAVEMDEFWSFVQNKKNQRWTWYAIEKQTGIIIAWHNGRRTDWDLRILLSQVQEIPIKKYYTDNLNFYRTTLMGSEHYVGKDQTWQIERKNLSFRTHLKRLNRRTICYSKNEEIHDNVIGMYIERFYYKSGMYCYNKNNGFNS